MTVITRWDPFREFTTVQDRLNRLFRESYGPEGREEALTTSSFAPPVDVYEDEHNVTLKPNRSRSRSTWALKGPWKAKGPAKRRNFTRRDGRPWLSSRRTPASDHGRRQG